MRSDLFCMGQYNTIIQYIYIVIYLALHRITLILQNLYTPGTPTYLLLLYTYTKCERTRVLNHIASNFEYINNIVKHVIIILHPFLYGRVVFVLCVSLSPLAIVMGILCVLFCFPSFITFLGFRALPYDNTVSTTFT